MNEELFYKVFDVGCTLIEAVMLLFLMTVLTDKNIRSKKSIWFIIWHVIITIVLTYTIHNLILKVIILSLGIAIGWCMIKKIDFPTSLLVTLLAMGWIISIQGMIDYIISFFAGDPSFNMGAFYFGSWQYTVIAQMGCICFTFLFCMIFWKKTFQWESKDLIIIGIIGYMELVLISSGLNKLNVNGVSARGELLISLCLFWVSFFLIIHFQQTSNLRMREEKENQRLQKLELEISHYQAKAEEEQKVKKIYHDMKNLLLAAKLTGEGAALFNTVEQELSEYGQYYETGNTFLNVILKEKGKLAEEKEIDMQLDIDFSEGSFIADRDIVTIFGNALDNAIEACEKLPNFQRMITIKAQKIRNMLSIMIENSMSADNNPNLHTTKEDTFLHGFGLVNIRESTEHYNGTCTTEIGENIFILRILIPIP